MSTQGIARSLAIALSIGLLSACGKGEQSHALDLKGAQQEYSSEMARLEFPSGVTKPTSSPLLTSGETYEAGVGSGAAQAQFLCAWQKQLLAKPAGPDAEKSLSMLDSFKKMTYYTKSYDQGSRDYFDKGLTAARLGDLSTVQKSVAANCS